MTVLFNNLPAGAFHLQNFVGEDTQMRLIQHCRDLCKSHPLMQPKTRSGHDLKLRVTSWGHVGWFGDYGRYYYMDKHQNGKRFPHIPVDIQLLMIRAARDCGFEGLKLETVLMNWYPPGTGKLGRHQDVTEEDRESPIVTISLGESCIFNIGVDAYRKNGIDIELHSGDVFVMGGESRLAFHEVKELIPGSSQLFKNGGRISLTGRKVLKREIAT